MLCLTPKQYDYNNIIINKKIKNNVIDDSYFYRIIYSDECISSNGIFILFHFTNTKIENYYNKIKCEFENNRKNNENIKVIKYVEKTILNKFKNIEDKEISTKLEEQLNNYNIKLFEDKKITIKQNNSMYIVLKISGVWATSTEIGVTFKFYMA